MWQSVLPILLTIMLFSPPSHAQQQEPPQMREAPKAPTQAPDVVLEWLEILDECFIDRICIQGHIHNQGKQTAYQVKLNVEIGGTKYSRPRIVLPRTVDQSIMEPGEQQDFDLTIDRKVTYKEKGKDKTIEVGKYNFKIVPVWSAHPEVKKTPPKPKKPTATPKTEKKPKP